MKTLKLEELRESSVLLASAPPALVRGTLYGFLLLVAAVLVWAYYVHVPVIVTAEGRIRPAGRIWRVDAETGGRVVTVTARENQPVSKGDLLVRLDPAPLTLEVKAAERDLEYLQPERDELRKMALVLGSFELGKESSLEGIRRHREEITAWLRELELAGINIRKNREELDRLAKLDKAVLVDADLARAKVGLAEAQASYKVAISRHRAKVEGDLETALQKIRELEGALERKREQLRRLDIVAPVDGTVTHVAVRHSGEVVAAGDRLLHIAPRGAGYMAEVWVPDHQAGFVDPGMDARVAVLTFPEATFGFLPGKVSSVAPDVSEDQQDPDRAPLYRVEVELEKDRLHARDGRVGHLRLGLLTRARLVVREERLLFHFIDALREAFRQGS